MTFGNALQARTRALLTDRCGPARGVMATAACRIGAVLGAAAGTLLGYAASAAAVGPAPETISGLPFTRSFPLEEIGNVSRGARLTFDAFGRCAVVQEGAYLVLNDTVWADLADEHRPGAARMVSLEQGRDGRMYYGARGDWGLAVPSPDGRVRASSIMPPDPPKWTRLTSFDQIVAAEDGIYFAGWHGVVHWNFARRESVFFELPSVSEIFACGGKVFVSSHSRPLSLIDVEGGVLRPVPETSFSGAAIEFAASLDATRTLIYSRDGRLMVFDGEKAEPWPAQLRNGLTGSVSALQALAEGGTAVAITGKGLFLVSPEGELVSSLTTSHYHRITGLAAREPGVLWVVVEDAIEKVLYGSPVTGFGQRLGIPASWPHVISWNGRIIVLNSGYLYEAVTGPPGYPTRFELMSVQPPFGAWAAAAKNGRLLVGNPAGIFVPEAEGGFRRVLPFSKLSHLVMVGEDLCFALGSREIAVLRWTDGQWTECAPRIAGAGYPAVVQAAKASVWMEFGGNSVARVALQDGRLKLTTFDQFTSPQARWVNIGVVDDTIVLSGAEGGRLFFDERTETFCEAPELRRLLDQSPYWINRVQKDEAGTLWATHNQGVVTFTPKGEGYEMDSSTFDLINDYYPAVRLLPGNDVWFTAGRSLHHVERRRTVKFQAPLRPILVSAINGRTETELVDELRAGHGVQLPFDQNNLRLRFFSGSYAWRRPPVYEFRLNNDQGWAALGAGSPLNLSGLREGRYRLEVRLAGGSAAPATFAFEVLPPWYRTRLAYLVYGCGLVLSVAGLVRWSSYRSRRRNLVLERLVRERTTQLEKTMQRLNEETRTAATLAERNRIAGEIHDSLQQGLSGAILQLDTTLLLPAVTGQIRSRLDVVRNMLSFTRHEVQHAVWDLESALLEDGELGHALRKLAALINSGTALLEVSVSGAPLVLPQAVRHDLLRIAQEATTNAVRHASAQRIAIELDYGFDLVTLTVADDGIGFEPDHVLSNNSVGHFGLRGLRGRVKRIRGELVIQSSPGEGTSLRVTVPVAHPAALPSDATHRAD